MFCCVKKSVRKGKCQSNVAAPLNSKLYETTRIERHLILMNQVSVKIGVSPSCRDFCVLSKFSVLLGGCDSVALWESTKPPAKPAVQSEASARKYRCLSKIALYLFVFIAVVRHFSTIFLVFWGLFCPYDRLLVLEKFLHAHLYWLAEKRCLLTVTVFS